MSEQEPVNALDREFEVGDIGVEGEVPEADPDLPAVDEDDLDVENGLLTTEPPDPADHDPLTPREPL